MSRPRADRRHAPLALLALAALVPAGALATLWQWAVATAEEPPPTTIAAEPPPPDPALDTGLLSLRRTADPLSEQLAEAAYRESLAPFLSEIGPSSCASIERDGTVLGAANPALPVIPASNQKLVVAAVALEVIGADTTFVTELRGMTPVNGLVEGDLYFVGGGDPVLATLDAPPRGPFPAINTTSLDALADAVVAAGIIGIGGTVVGDGSRYDDEFYVPTWGDGIARVESGPYDALLVNDGVSAATGLLANDPAKVAADELRRLLDRRDVHVDVRTRTGTAPAEGVVTLASVESAPLWKIVQEMLLTSDDNTAEMLLKEIGFRGGAGGTRVGGLDVVATTLAGWGVPLEGVTLDDGSGLSRLNRLTCGAVIGVLGRLADAPHVAELLPVAGRSGTLTEQLVGTPGEGIVHAKTGTLTDVRTLSGYYLAADGELTFALLLNGPGIQDPAAHVPTWEALVAALDAHPVRPDPAPLAPR